MEVKPGYKQTEVGIIPEEWEAATIGDVCSFSGGSQPPRSTFRFVPTPGYIRLIQIRDYKSDDFASYIPEALARKRCSSDDIMIGRYGPPVFQILRGIEGAYNVALIKTTLTPKVDREFFFNALNQEPLFQLIDALSRRSSGQTGVEMPALKAYGLPLPTLPEQRAIAVALSDVDGLLGGLDRLIAKKRDLKQAAMQQLLTGQTRLPGFHGEWEVKRLDELADIRSGGTPSTSEPLFWDGDILWCTPTDITALNGHKYLGETSRTITQLGLKASSAEMIPAHSVVMTSRATIGECAINAVPLSTNQGFKNFVPFATTDVDFLYYLLGTQKQGFISLCGGSTFLEIGKAQLAVYEVRLPSTKAEQTAIAEVLSEMDGELAVLEQRREKTRALKQAMMQELLTGRTRLL
jgi:type I restriction enzyme S subunit